MTEPNGICDDGVNPCIELAGKRWPIPLFGPRQNRMVVPAVSRITKRMREVAETKFANLSEQQRQAIVAGASPDAARLGSDVVLRKHVWSTTDFGSEMIALADTEFFDQLSDAVFWALKRAHPQMSREEFDEMPIATLDMIDAVGTIAQQTGMMRKTDPSADPLARPG
jgi:hypothetical protein